MQKHITKFLILTIILTAALSVNYLFAAWVGPTQAPPGGNTSTPIHVGSTNQVKEGGLSVEALSVFGSGYFQGNVGVGVVVPTQKLDIGGKIKVGNDATSPDAGTIRWTGTDFEGYDGTQWQSLTSEEVTEAPSDATDCQNAGGDWHNVQQLCYFGGTSCASSWQRVSSYSTVNQTSCTASCSSGCTIPSHYRQNTGGSCTYYGCNKRGRQCGGCSNRTCSAGIVEVGCTKN